MMATGMAVKVINSWENPGIILHFATALGTMLENCKNKHDKIEISAAEHNILRPVMTCVSPYISAYAV
jgi:hypothetical protein